jgi:anti-anti-sigma regulatory factor
LEEALFFGETGTGLYIRATGHITATLCSDLKGIVYGRLDRSEGSFLKEIIMDLSQCDYMDSTFMGLIVGFNKKLIKISGNQIQILNPSLECLKLLKSLGIIKLLNIVESPEKKIKFTMAKLSKSEKPTAELLLKAHEDLSELSPENEKKFSVLQSILKKQLESGE